MRIAIDYDDTYTADRGMFSEIIRIMQSAGHEVSFVTARIDMKQPKSYNMDIERDAERLDINVIYCSHEQKRVGCEKAGWMPDIWIDDMPEAICR